MVNGKWYVVSGKSGKSVMCITQHYLRFHTIHTLLFKMKKNDYIRRVSCFQNRMSVALDNMEISSNHHETHLRWLICRQEKTKNWKHIKNCKVYNYCHENWSSLLHKINEIFECNFDQFGRKKTEKVLCHHLSKIDFGIGETKPEIRSWWVSRMLGGELHIFSIQLNDTYDSSIEFSVRRKDTKFVPTLHSIAASKIAVSCKSLNTIKKIPNLPESLIDFICDKYHLNRKTHFFCLKMK